MRGNCVPEATLSAVTKHMLWLKQDGWPGDTGCPADVFRELRSIDKLCTCQSNKCVAQAEPRITLLFT